MTYQYSILVYIDDRPEQQSNQPSGLQDDTWCVHLDRSRERIRKRNRGTSIDLDEVNSDTSHDTSWGGWSRLYRRQWPPQDPIDRLISWLFDVSLVALTRRCP